MTRIIHLIGKNPLPVAVAARRLAAVYQEAECRAVYTVGPGGSEKEYACIRDLTKDWVRWDGVGELKDAYNPEGIDRAAQDAANGCGERDTVHLHYTGGTKAMGVHAITALQRLAGSNKFSLTSSYLDPENHWMHFWPSNLGEKKDERRNDWSLDPETLAKLHGMERMKWSPPGPRSAAARWIVDLLVGDPGKRKQFNEWVRDFERSFRNSSGDYWQDWSKCPRKPFWPTVARWPPTNDDWSGAALALNDDLKSQRISLPFIQESAAWKLQFPDVNNNGREAYYNSIYRYLVGEVLECYAWEALADVLQYHNPRRSFEAYMAGACQSCEVDLAFVLGYQLVVISCTTSISRGLVKSKAFEVWHRARQIGGDQARAILLCLIEKEKASDLQADLARDIGTSDLALRVWGVDAIQDGLAFKLSSYLEDTLKWK